MKLYIGNLPFQASEGDLQDWFAAAGISVDSITLIRDKFSGQLRGFGFVEIDNDDMAQQAVRACNGRELMGRSLVVNEARPMGAAPPRSGGAAGGGGRRPGGREGRGGGAGGGGGRGRW